MPEAFVQRLREKSWTRLQLQILSAKRSLPLTFAIQGPVLTEKTYAGALLASRTWYHAWRDCLRAGWDVTFEERTTRGGCRTFRPKSVRATTDADLARIFGDEAVSTLRRMQHRITDILALNPAAAGPMTCRAELAGLPEPEFLGLLDLIRERRADPEAVISARETTASGLHSKWIETHSGLVSCALHGLACRDGVQFRKDDNRILKMRFHPLDNCGALGSCSFGITPSEIRVKPAGILRALVVENLATFNSLRPAPGNVVIFGEGRAAVSTLADVAWIRHVDLFYWGDCDSHGYAILAAVRRAIPHTKSLFMDDETVAAHAALWVDEPLSARLAPVAHDLTGPEAAARRLLHEGSARLEQERVRLAFPALVRMGMAEATTLALAA